MKSTKKKVRLRVLAAARRSPPQPAAARRSPPQPAAARATIGAKQNNFSANGGVFYSPRRKQRDLTGVVRCVLSIRSQNAVCLLVVT